MPSSSAMSAAAVPPRPLLVFSHANSFPAATYGVLFAELERRGLGPVRAVERYGHDPRYPVSDNWPHLVRQLSDFVAEQCAAAAPAGRRRAAGAAAPRPVYLVGHSLGGYLSLLVACRATREPPLAGHGACSIAGVVLLDSPLLGGWRARALGVAKRTQLVGALSPGAVSRKRRKHWPSLDAVREHFRHKRAFAGWDPRVLEDYCVHGTVDDGAGGRTLLFDRDVETAIYDSLPDHLDELLARQPPAAPVAFIGGLKSEEVRRVGLQLTERVCKGRLTMLDGSHLFPMEKPRAAAAAIEAALLNLGWPQGSTPPQAKG
jgi:pimeloyl-ACP methyl ester carboxylesterase